MAWTTLTEDDVKTRLAGAELAAYTTVALANGQTSPLAPLIAQVVDEVRGYCAVRNTLGEGSTIPAKLVSAAVDILRYRLTTRLPLKVTDERKAEYTAALTLLRDVAAGKFAIEDAETAEDEVTQGGGRSVITARTLTSTRALQDGI